MLSNYLPEFLDIARERLAKRIVAELRKFPAAENVIRTKYEGENSGCQVTVPQCLAELLGVGD